MSKVKMLVSALPILLAAVTNPAAASEFYNPDDSGTGGCAAAHYANNDWYEWSWFVVPAMKNGTFAQAEGMAGNNTNSHYQLAYFWCDNGTISGGYGYESAVEWSAL